MHFHIQRLRRYSESNNNTTPVPTNDNNYTNSGIKDILNHGSTRLRSASVSAVRGSNSRTRNEHHSDHTHCNIHHLTESKILEDLGLQRPIPVKTTTQGSLSKTIKCYVSNTNNCIYLPPASSNSFTYEDVENGGSVIADEQQQQQQQQQHQQQQQQQQQHQQSSGSSLLDASRSNVSSASTGPNLLSTKIDGDHPIPHLFALVIEVGKESTVQPITIKFQSITQLLWPSGDIYNKGHSKEKFKIGSLQWETNLGEADYYINNLGLVKQKSNINPGDLAKRTRDYNLLTESVIRSKPQINEIYKAGLYVFLLPISLTDTIPPSITSINGSLNHTLSVNFNKISDKFNRKLKVNANYNLPMVRTPPNFANSTADKPIYVNRVWNDAIHYIITFPKKYVSLGSEHVINVKLVPLVKDVVVKRIKFNVLERITYFSKDLSREYDFDSEEPYSLHSKDSNKVRERVVSLCELKTKQKQASNSSSDPYKEEIVKCPENNLLYSCYELEDDLSKHKNKNHDKSMIASPLDINIALPFLTTKIDKDEDETGNNHNVTSPTNSRKASIINDSLTNVPSSPVIGALETNLSNVDEIGLHELKPDSSNYLTDDLTSKHSPSENIKNGYTTIGRALYPDSNFRHIQIHHRLQVCFRISKPDPKDDFKMHHYEVVVDTPLILLSSKCSDTSIQLPTYDEVPKFKTSMFNLESTNGVSIKPWIVENDSIDDQLPTFEEATSSPGSPMIRSVSITDDPLSRSPSISLPNDSAPPAYEAKSIAKQNDSLTSLNIDEIVEAGLIQDSSTLSKPSRRESIRESLSNSFARSNPSQPQVSSLHPFESNSLSDEGSSIQSNETPASSTLPDSTSISSSNESSIEQMKKIPSHDSNSEQATVEDDEAIADENAIVDEEDDEVGSLYTQDTNTNFEQRVPLLHHTSSDTIKTFNLNNSARISTESLTPQNQRTFID